MQAETRAFRGDAEAHKAYGWYLLLVLALVYIFNFVDRQLLTILAPELKRDLGISDSDFGFLYGTAFGVFYAVFGIPLGKLADRWVRVRLLAWGLALWSMMTALSGLSNNFGQLAVTRIGVGVGEATLSPCTYSLISDYFPPHRRATALGIYSAGLYLGTGISLFLGSSIVAAWTGWFPQGGAPFNLSGWQAAFLLVGLPGLLLSLWVATLREPPRGRYDGAGKQVPALPTGRAWREFGRDLTEIVPPLTLLAALAQGPAAVAANLAAAAVLAVICTVLIAATGDHAQWIAVGIGCYAICSWLAALRRREPQTYAALAHSRAFLGVTIGYSLLSFVGYANIAFSPLYAIQQLRADPTAAGVMLGSLGALGGSLGVISGGLIADRLAGQGDNSRRVMFTGLAAAGTMIGHAIMFQTTSLPLFYGVAFITVIVTSATLGGASGTVVNIVPSHLRGTATAAFLLGTNMIGLGLGPYTAGRLSERLGDLGLGLSSLSLLLPPTLVALLVSYRALRGSHRGDAFSPP